MTFPLMSGGLIRKRKTSDGDSLGALYFANSAGAAAGVLVAAFLLLPLVGLPGSMIVAGLINLFVAAVAWWVAKDLSAPARKEVNPAEKSVNPQSKRLLHVVVFATLFSSAASFAYEILFVRMLSLAVGTTLHAFELMLASFIAGIALGALWIRRRADSAISPLRLLAIMQVLMGLTALMALAIYSNAFSWVGFLVDSLARTDGGYVLFNVGTALIAVLIMVPTAFFAGTTLPLFTVTLLRDGQGESSIGRVYAWNTIGAIVGVLAAIHLLIPLFGIKLAMIAAAGIDIAIGVLLLRYIAENKNDFLRVYTGFAVMATAVVASLFLIPFDPMKLGSGVYRSGADRLSDNSEILFYNDGKTASVSVAYSATGRMHIATNGKIDASIQTFDDQKSTMDEPTMILAGALPLAYKRDAQTAAVIGFGSGLTTHALLGSNRLGKVDTIEIEPQMVEGARWFGPMVARAYDDARSNIIIDDAKSFFAGQQREYDIIISEPSNPWISGVGALFSTEFYEFVPRFVSEDGIFLQWLQLYEIDAQLVGSVLNGFVPAFPASQAYLSNNADLLIVASKAELSNSPSFEDLFLQNISTDLEGVGITSPDHLRFRRIANSQMLSALARLYDAEANSDYFPILSLEAPRTRFRRQSAAQIISLASMRNTMLEWLDVRYPPPESVVLPTHDHFRADSLANEARAIRRLILDLEPIEEINVSPNVEQWTRELTFVANVCQNFPSEQAGEWLSRRLLELTESTLPFLDADGLRGILINPVWATCTSYPTGLELAFQLVEAHALRDSNKMINLSKQWLDNLGNRPQYLERFDPFAFATYQFGLIDQERFEDARNAEDEYGELVPAEGEYGFSRSVILAWLAPLIDST
jgi:predicted membrane-bound spermidine synthase